MWDDKESLLLLNIDKHLNVNLSIDSLLVWLSILGVIIVISIVLYKNRSFSSYEIDEAELGIGDHKFKLKPNNTDRQIAYKIWVELSTRKIGLPIDFEHDVIIEIYDSWYAFFSVTRELIKDVPVSKVRREETKAIINMSIEVLNQGLRPHLTLWQARFRRWYNSESIKQENINLSPQDIQKKFDKYSDLIKDLQIINTKLIGYRNKMNEIIK